VRKSGESPEFVGTGEVINYT